MDWEDCSQISAFDRVCGLDRATHAMKKIYYSMYIIHIYIWFSHFFGRDGRGSWSGKLMVVFPNVSGFCRALTFCRSCSFSSWVCC